MWCKINQKRFKSGLVLRLHFESMLEPANSSDFSKLLAELAIYCKNKYISMEGELNHLGKFLTYTRLEGAYGVVRPCGCPISQNDKCKSEWA